MAKRRRIFPHAIIVRQADSNVNREFQRGRFGFPEEGAGREPSLRQNGTEQVIQNLFHLGGVCEIRMQKSRIKDFRGGLNPAGARV